MILILMQRKKMTQLKKKKKTIPSPRTFFYLHVKLSTAFSMFIAVWRGSAC